MDDYDPFEDEFVRWLASSPRGVRTGDVGRAMTGLLLVADPTRSIRSLLTDRTGRKRYSVDHKLIESIYRAAPARMRLRVLSSAAAWMMPTAMFSRLCAEASTRKLSANERNLAAQALHLRLNFYPKEVKSYIRYIRDFLHDSNASTIIQTMPSVAKLPRLNSTDIDSLSTLLTGPNDDVKMVTLSAISETL